MLEITRQGIAVHKIKSEKFKYEKKIIHAFYKNNGTFGKRHIQKWLKRRKIYVSLPTIAKVMKRHNLVSVYGRKCKKKRDKTPAEYTAEYIAKDKTIYTQFLDLVCADITVMKCYKEILYVSATIDVVTKYIVGLSMATNMKQELVHESIQDMFNRFGTPQIYHCDRGSQYTALKTKALLESKGVTISMSRPGSPNDNQPIESFWHTMKTELDEYKKKTAQETAEMVFRYVMHYNTERLHSSIGYMTPQEAKRAFSPRGE